MTLNPLIKSWETRRKKYGPSGFSLSWRIKRIKVQAAKWRQPKYREQMRKAHQHPNHRDYVVHFALNLMKRGFSCRKAAVETSKAFDIKLTHEATRRWKKDFSKAIRENRPTIIDNLSLECLKKSKIFSNSNRLLVCSPLSRNQLSKDGIRCPRCNSPFVIRDGRCYTNHGKPRNFILQKFKCYSCLRYFTMRC